MASQDSAQPQDSQFTALLKRTFVPVLLPLAVMWVLFIISMLMGGWINRQLGLIPRDLAGAVGIAFMPLLHANFAHIIGNSLSWLVMGGAISLITRRFTLVMGGIWVLSGTILWLFGPPWHMDYGFSRHIGASAMVYGFAAFLVAYGWLSRHIGAIVVGVLVIFFNGIPMILGMFPVTAGSGVSWFGHLSGVIAGVIVAFILTKEARAERARTSRRRNDEGTPSPLEYL